MSRFVLLGLWSVIGWAFCASAMDQSPLKPPYERLLEGQDAATAKQLDAQANAAEVAGHCDEALRLRSELLALRTRV